MGAFELNMPDDILNQYNFTEEELKDIVADVSPILQREMQQSIQNVISEPGDSRLVGSVRATRPKSAKTDAVMAWVGPSGSDHGVRNIEKAIYLNYGTHNAAGGIRQPARPWLTKAINNAQGAVEKGIRDAIERKLNK